MQHQEENSPLPNNIGRCIKKYGYNYKEIADEIGVSRQTLWRYIAGERAIPRDILEKLAFTLGCKIEDLVVPREKNVQVYNQVGPLAEHQELVEQLRKSILQDIMNIAGSAYIQSPNIMQHVEQSTKAIDSELISFFESTLATQWDLYFMGGAGRVVQGLDILVKEIEKLVRLAQGTSWLKRVLMLLTMVHQLQSCVLRDRIQYPQAHAAYQRAFDVAQELENSELMASALAREGVTLIQQEKSKQAIMYLENALNIIEEQNFPKLRGYILQALSEANAQGQRVQECWESIDQAEEIVLQPIQERSLIRFNPTVIVAQRGVDAVLLKDYKGAVELIDSSLKTYDPTGVRGRARLVAQRAEAYYGLGILDACMESAREAVKLARSVGASKTIIRIEKLSAVLDQSPWKKDKSVAQLRAILNDIEQ